jgi:hypothetical protein
MKKLILYFVAITVLGCTSKETREMPGAYNMVSQSLHDGKKDSVIVGVKQLKIYTPDYMMYTRFGVDSISSFGIATYGIVEGSIKENLFYSSVDSTEDVTNPLFHLDIESTSDGYKQVITGLEAQGKKYTLTEEYKSVGELKTSPLDGAWEIVKSYSITGQDTTTNDIKEYKTYFAGHVMFGLNYLDSLKLMHTAIGYGGFVMQGDNKVKETFEVSTFPFMRGASFDVDIEFEGSDRFKQTITEASSRKNCEVWERLIK